MFYVRSVVSAIPRDAKRDLNFAAEAAKREAEMKTRFLATMSHDIRTPLNGIIGMVNMGNQYADDPKMQQKIREKEMEALKYLVSPGK
ncbi:MAG: histidine kinase dimerization/phospho-acceptor domain-containing protein [Lachnospiraceae bacterium]